MAYQSVIMAALVVVSLLFLVAAALFLTAARNLKRRYNKLMMGRDSLNLEQLLNEIDNRLSEGWEKQIGLERRMEEAENKIDIAIAGVGMVRFNAFQETGSDLSFSLALLDRNNNGAIITSIFGREESRCYGKPVANGKSSYHLSEEEEQALAEARRNFNA